MPAEQHGVQGEIHPGSKHAQGAYPFHRAAMKPGDAGILRGEAAGSYNGKAVIHRVEQTHTRKIKGDGKHQSQAQIHQTNRPDMVADPRHDPFG